MERERVLDYIPLATKVLVVAVKGYADDWTAYVDAVKGINHDEEKYEVTRNGSKLPKELGILLFPNINKLYKWRD